MGFLGSTADKESAGYVGDLGSTLSHEDHLDLGHDNLLQYSSLENPKNIGAWWAKVHGVAKNLMRLSTAQHISLCNRNRYLFPMIFQSGSIY